MLNSFLVSRTWLADTEQKSCAFLKSFISSHFSQRFVFPFLVCVCVCVCVICARCCSLLPGRSFLFRAPSKKAAASSEKIENIFKLSWNKFWWKIGEKRLTLCRWLLRRSAEKSVCCHWRLGRRRVSSSPFFFIEKDKFSVLAFDSKFGLAIIVIMNLDLI